MVIANQPIAQAPSWQKAFTHPVTEFGPIGLSILSGAIPVGLRGSFYRNGPARLERGGERVGHLFDGDGAILAAHFTDAGVTGIYRYVQTEAYQAEEKAGKFIFGSYGRTPSGSFWQKLGLPMKNCANTSVLALPHKLLALWEAGPPHALDLKTLETHGIDLLGGLAEDAPYSAHPKQDPQTGDIYNFGITYGRKANLNLYRSDATGQIRQQNAIPLEGLPLIHDFVLTDDYLVFFIPPVRLNPLPFLTRTKSFSESLSWKPERGTQILVVDRETLTVVSRGKTEPWFQWRFGNGYQDGDGTLAIDVVRFEDFRINQYLQEVAALKTQTLAKGTLWQIRLDPRHGTILTLRPKLERSCEFPSISPAQMGRPSRYTYLALHRQGTDISQELFNSLARFDSQTGQLTEADLGFHRYCAGPIYAPDAINPSQGWILTEIFAGDRHQSEFWIFAADGLDSGPVCRIALPQVIPLGFHGTWKAA